MKIVIIGGGASGMILASMIKNEEVVLIEKNNKLGKKLLLTGNGKCNFTNDNFENLDRIYNNDFAKNIFRMHDNKEMISYFESIGIYPKKEIHKGIIYYYPNSNKSTSVYYNLLDKIINNGVNIYYDCEVVDINKINDCFELTLKNGKKMKCDKLILATGGMSYKNTGSNGLGYNLAKKMGHTVIDPVPGLVALKIDNNDLTKLKGVRVEAKVKYKNIYEEIGEIQFTEHGVSGIPIMNISRYISKDLCTNDKIYISVDYNVKNIDINKFIFNRKNNISYKKTVDFLCGYLPDEIGSIIIERAKIDKNKLVSNLTNDDMIKIIKNISDFSIIANGTNGFDNAQITLGGINTNEINIETLESKIVKNLYFCGEIMDIDGICGGYNLQLAYSTASIVSNSIKKYI